MIGRVGTISRDIPKTIEFFSEVPLYWNAKTNSPPMMNKKARRKNLVRIIQRQLNKCKEPFEDIKTVNQILDRKLCQRTSDAERENKIKDWKIFRENMSP